MPAPIRVGAVSYLNAKPLYYRLTEFAPGISLEMDLPSLLADRLGRGELDVALIPSVDFGAAAEREPVEGWRVGPALSVPSRAPRRASASPGPPCCGRRPG